MPAASTSYKHLHTTSVEPSVTAAEMTKVLALLRAKSINMLMDRDGELTGITFVLAMPRPDGAEHDMTVRLPVNWAPLYQALLSEPWKGASSKRAERAMKLKAQAKRTAWRLALEWLKVNAVFLQHKLRHPAEVFLADMIVEGTDETLGQRLLAGKTPMLLIAPASHP